MNKKQSRERLAILPGGQQHYVETVFHILRFVQQQGQQVPINAVGEHLSHLYHVRSHRLNEPVWDVVCLGLLAVENRRVSLTPTGQAVLDADADVRNRLVLVSVLSHFTAVLEVLCFALDYPHPFSCKEAHDALKPTHPRWNDPQLTQRPINWLLSTGALRDTGGARFEITPRGRSALGELVANEEPSSPLTLPVAQTGAQLARLIEILPQSSLDSPHFSNLEHEAASTVTCVGFKATVKGQSGTPMCWSMRWRAAPHTGSSLKPKRASMGELRISIC